MTAYQALQYNHAGSALFTKTAGAKPSFLEFFAGSGLVCHALEPYFKLAWANDVCPKKANVFRANNPGSPFELRSITDVCGASLPSSSLSWASFPCQDLSLAGNISGIQGKRSGLVWEWLRVIDEMAKRPPVLVAENVVGLVSTHNGEHYKELHHNLTERGYAVGAMLLDAVRWLPHSRPRVFIVAVDKRVNIPKSLLSNGSTWLHNSSVERIAQDLTDWIWWKLPEPKTHRKTLTSIIDFHAPCHDETTTQKNLALIPKEHFKRLQESGLTVAPGYKRIRQGKQVLELRFDDIAGCLRTPIGGSSRQFLIIRQGSVWRTRIITPREAARLMGAPEQFMLPGTFNDGYKAMGDAVAAPVAAYLARHLLSPLVAACNDLS